MHLYLARHGETVWNIEARVQGWGDSPLTETGIRQAEALADRLADIPLVAVYSSDLGRAASTAEIVAKRHGLKVETMPAFREMSWGDWEGLTWQQMEAGWPDTWKAFVKKGREELTSDEEEWETTTHIPGGETMAETAKRVYAGIDEIIARHPGAGDCALIVGHGGSLRMAFTHALSLRPRVHRRFHLDNTGLSCIDYPAGGVPRIRFTNDTGHWREVAPPQVGK